jgi:hypothetical protein
MGQDIGSAHAAGNEMVAETGVAFHPHTLGKPLA